MKTEYLIHIDSREQRPLPFPVHVTMLDPTVLPQRQQTRCVRIRTEAPAARKALPFADYLLGDDPGACYTAKDSSGGVIVERKYSLSELHANVFNPVKRRSFVRCLDNMRKHFVYPVLLLEGTPAELNRGHAQAAIVWDGLQRLLLERRISLWHLPGKSETARRETAILVAKLLINGALTHGNSPARLLS